MSQVDFSAVVAALQANDEEGFVKAMGPLRDRLRGAFQGKLLELLKSFLQDLWSEFSNDPTKIWDLLGKLLGGWGITLPPVGDLPTTSGANVAALSTWDSAALAKRIASESEGDVEVQAVDWTSAILQIIIQVLLKLFTKPAEPTA